MARVLDELPGTGRKGPPDKYPWAEWMDGRAWAVIQGEDYDCQHESLRVRFSARASKAGLSLQMRMLKENGEQVGWAFQFSRNGNEAA